MLEARVALMHVKAHEMVKISRALHYSLSRNHTVVSASKTPGEKNKKQLHYSGCFCTYMQM